MLEEDLEIAIKVVVVGNGAVGKSSMIQRYCKGLYTQDYKKTIGVDFLEREIQIDDEAVRLMVWDTAGQEEFDAITKAYYRGAEVCVLTFSTTDKASLDAVEKWKEKVEAECGSIVTVLVQNKIDLIEESVVSPEEVESLAKRLKLRLVRTSVKQNFNVDQVFEYLARKYIEKKKKAAIERAESQERSSSLAGIFSASVENHLDNAGRSGTPTSNNSTGNGQSFKIKPNKERVKKKRTFCAVI